MSDESSKKSHRPGACPERVAQIFNLLYRGSGFRKASDINPGAGGGPRPAECNSATQQNAIQCYRALATVFLALSILLCACQKPAEPTPSSPGEKPLTIGVSFETLQTEFWVAALQAFRDELKQRQIKMLEAIADGDANRQFEQIRNFITRKVDGIIVVPKDSSTIVSMIKSANQAQIPIVLFNRPPAPSEAKSVTIVADNFAITKATVDYLCQQAKQSGQKYKAALLIGDLGDVNAIGRRDGYEAATKEMSDIVQTVARIPTEWNQEKAQAGLVNALQAHPEINFIFSSSDFLFPSVVSALKTAGKYKKVGDPGHVLLGGFDGDATAYQMLIDGYLDADGVQDVFFEAKASVQSLLDLRAGKQVPDKILDSGFVIHQGNRSEKASQMWGARLKKQ